MKAAIRFPARFFLWFALVLLALSALALTHAHVTGFDPLAASGPDGLARRVQAAVAVSLLPSVLLACCVSLFSVLASRLRAALPLVLLGACWTVLLFASGWLLGRYPVSPPATAPVLPAGSIVRFGTVRVFAGTADGERYSDVVVHDPEREPGFSAHREAQVDPVRGLLTVDSAPSSPLELSAMENAFAQLARAPQAVDGLFADLRALSRILAFEARPTGAALNLAALSLYLLACWTLVRLTRWPLFNAAILLAAIRFAVWLLPAVDQGPLRPLVIAALDSRALSQVSALVLALIAAGLLALSVLLRPLEEWHREVSDG